MPTPTRMITVYTPGTSGEMSTTEVAAITAPDDETSVEVVIDDQGLLTATEAKRPKMDEVLGKKSKKKK